MLRPTLGAATKTGTEKSFPSRTREHTSLWLHIRLWGHTRLLIIVTAYSLLLALGACTPGVTGADTSVAAQGETSASTAQRPADPERLWTAVVTGGERWAGLYQGEQGHAVMQDGQLLELELQNLAFGMGRFTTSLESPPFLFRFAPEEMLVPFAGVVLRYENPTDRDKFNASFTGQPTQVEVRVEDGRLHGQLSFELKNSIGETVQLTVYDLNVPAR